MLIALYITVGYFTLFFLIATLIKNNSIVDIGWGFGFVLTSWILFFLNGNHTLTSILANSMVSLWGLRLFYHILKRNLFEKEDFRYANWRNAWGKWVVPRAFIQVFMLQAIFQFMIGSTTYYLNTFHTEFKIVSLIGILIWLVGYYYQVIGDRQLKKFIKNKTKQTPILKNGLWSKTRHPNYFGESVMWWGIYIFGLLNGVAWYFIISPLTITIVLYFISIPLLEEKMSKTAGWDDYRDNTPMFVPIKCKK